MRDQYRVLCVKLVSSAARLDKVCDFLASCILTADIYLIRIGE